MGSLQSQIAMLFKFSISSAVDFGAPEFLEPMSRMKAIIDSRWLNTYHVFGSVADRNWTCTTPTSNSANCANAALVMSICLDPGAQPAQVSTTRTKTHFFGVLQTGCIRELLSLESLVAYLPKI